MSKRIYTVLETVDGRGRVYCLAADRQSAEKFLRERVLQCECHMAYQETEGGFYLLACERVFQCHEVAL